MATFSVSFKEFWGDVVPNLQPRVGNSIKRSLDRAGHRGVGLVVEEIDTAKPYPAVDTGGLRQSVNYTPSRKGPGHLSVDAPYAAAIEYGTRPFRPPIEPLAEWALRKGVANTEAEARGIAFAIAEKFSREGIAPRHYFRRAMARLKPVVQAEIRSGLRETAKRGWMWG